jgi:MFS family permease
MAGKPVTASNTEGGSSGAGGSDLKVMTLIGVAHFLSHFYILILPPLFPLLTDAYGVGYVELGLAIGLANATTALTQAPVGFLVDRFGARGFLIAGLALFAGATALIGLFPTYPALIVLMVFAGLGNSVFHPADYSILSGAIDGRRMGRAFSIHTFAGFAGFAAAPPVVVALNALIGWRVALILTGGIGVLIALIMLLNSAVLSHRRGAAAGRQRPPAAGTDIRLLLSFPVLASLLMFALLALGNAGITNYSVAALAQIYDLPLAGANLPLTAFLVASTAGVLAGGWMADRTAHQDRAAGCYMVILSLALLPVAALSLPLWLIAILVGISGFFSGAIAPSRDMMVRSITPDGASGKVFGFVTSGFNIGGIIAPLIFGMIMDGGAPRGVFYLVAATGLLTLGSILMTGRQAKQRPPAAAPH